MIFKCVGTGSKGNCYLVSVNERYLALDTGCKWKDVMKAVNYNVKSIDCALVTHEHGDHSKYYPTFIKNGIHVYSGEESAKRLKDITGVPIETLRPMLGTDLKKRWRVIPIPVNHEDVPNYSYLITTETNERILYITDFEYCMFTFKTWNIDYFIISVNHSEYIPSNAAAREHRINGHASLKNVKAFLESSVTDKCKGIVAVHLSDVYADENKIKSVLRGTVPNNTKVYVAHNNNTIYM